MGNTTDREVEMESGTWCLSHLSIHLSFSQHCAYELQCISVLPDRRGLHLPWDGLCHYSLTCSMNMCVRVCMYSRIGTHKSLLSHVCTAE